MKPNEIVWRGRKKIRAALDRVFIPLKVYPDINTAFSQSFLKDITSIDLVTDCTHDKEFYRRHFNEVKLIAEADQITECRLNFFNLENCYLGKPINWLADHASNITSPLKFSESIDYRDFEAVGDCKLVWEPNRHHQFYVMARAYHISKDEKYIHAIIEQLSSWHAANPFGYGMNWRSPLELGVRLINWTWTYDLIKRSSLVTDDFKKKFFYLIYLHCWEITRKYSKGSSANNHLIGEAAGVYIASAYFSGLSNAGVWREQAKKILCEEIVLQSHEDGGSKEQALGYQYFVIQFFLFCGWMGRCANNPFGDQYWQRLDKMVRYLKAFSEACYDKFMYGDKDDGYVLNMGAAPHDTKSLLSVFAVLSGSVEIAQPANLFSEFSWWIHGDAGVSKFEGAIKTASDNSVKLCSKAFQQTGYYFLQSGECKSDRSISLIMDVAELGYGSIAAHGHADALSFVLRVGGENILVDPGTYDYFSYPEWRSFFRSTRAHNTLEIDALDQSEMMGPFLWRKRANSKCLDWKPSRNGGVIEAMHDGYWRLSDPVTHVRKIEMNADHGLITIKDKLLCKDQHRVSVTFQFSPKCIVEKQINNQLVIQCADIVLEMQLADQLEVEIYRGNEHEYFGWYSDAYHRKVRAFSVVGKVGIMGNAEFVTTITRLR